MDTQSIIGKRISYYDGFSGSTTTFKITEVKFDGNGYEVRDTGRDRFLYFGMGAMKELIESGKFEQTLTIDHCPVRETYEIQGQTQERAILRQESRES